MKKDPNAALATLVTVLVEQMTVDQLDAAGMKLLELSVNVHVDKAEQKFFRTAANAIAEELRERGAKA